MRTKLECGCIYDRLSIDFCPIHKHAEEMRDKLIKLVEWVSGIAQDYVPNDVFHLSGGFDFMKDCRYLLQITEKK